MGVNKAITDHLFELLRTKCGKDGIVFSDNAEYFDFWELILEEDHISRYHLMQPKELFKLIDSDPDQFSIDCLSFMSIMILMATYDIASEDREIELGPIWIDGMRTRTGSELLFEHSTADVTQINTYSESWKASWDIHRRLLPGAWLGVANEAAKECDCNRNEDYQNAFYLGPEIRGLNDCDEIAVYQLVTNERYVSLGDIIREMTKRTVQTSIDHGYLEKGFVLGESDYNSDVLNKILELGFHATKAENIDYEYTYNIMRDL